MIRLLVSVRCHSVVPDSQPGARVSEVSASEKQSVHSSDQASGNYEIPMDTCVNQSTISAESTNAQPTSKNKLPPPINQSIFHSNAPVNIPNSSASRNEERGRRNSNLPVNDCSTNKGHVSRSRSVCSQCSRAKSPVNRKASNSNARNKVQGSKQLQSEAIRNTRDQQSANTDTITNC